MNNIADQHDDYKGQNETSETEKETIYTRAKKANKSYRERQQDQQKKNEDALRTIAKQILNQQPVPERQPKPNDLELGSDMEIADKALTKLDLDHDDVHFTDANFIAFDSQHWASLDQKQILELVKFWDGAWYPPGGHIRLNMSRFKSIVTAMQIQRQEIDFFKDAPIGANFQNGFLEIDPLSGDTSFSSHSPEQRQRFTLPIAWDGEMRAYDDLPKDSLIRTLLNGSMLEDPEKDEKIRLLGELAGAPMFGLGTRLASPKCAVLLGINAENGKSQYLKMIGGLLPANVVSHVSPSNFGKQEYLIDLAGRLLNTSDELGTAKAIAGDTFKSVVTGDPVQARDLYNSRVTFRPAAQHVFSGNKLPGFTGGFDPGVYRRLALLEFLRVIPEKERIPLLAEKILAEEMSYAVSFAVHSVARLLRNGKFTRPKSSEDALREWAGLSDPVVGWLQMRIDMGPHDVLAKPPHMKSSEAYADFCAWYEEEGYDRNSRPAIASFTQRLREREKEYRFHYQASHRLFVGMRLRKDTTPAMTETAKRFARELDYA